MQKMDILINFTQLWGEMNLVEGLKNKKLK